jgi:predicted Na+-dependent transporter
MKQKHLATLLAAVILLVFYSFDVVAANITIDYTLEFLWILVIGEFIFLIAVVGWAILRWLRQKRKEG